MARSTSAIADNLKSPLFFTPEPHARVWGGRLIGDLFGRPIPDGAVGESWEIHGALTVASGALAGRTLDSLLEEFGTALVGRRGPTTGAFPLLTKWLDCRDWLSVQIHPDDALAVELTGSAEERGKSEAWYVARRDEDAELIHGLKKGVDVEHAVRLRDKELLDALNFSTPDQGEILYTAAGVVHALGPGFLIYEVQQSSDLTYRFYDWGRDREIHVEQAGRCLLEAQQPPSKQTEKGLYCPYFSIETLFQDDEWELDGTSFEILACVDGECTLRGEFGRHEMKFGDSLLLPAALGGISAQLRSEGRLLRIALGEEAS